ncbi:MAG: hypothetical protein RMK91_08495 [Pseudanabaenaceae cyanobacterium SKYGB_i_bin29]|nr:hypothetical protein [Pseudanabaenaceae cyanobacterium SKYG29]MDW8421894.1 hypothetical protein [Pseudanabaenaceae cyanobacterium SKYGB_i_bin29]
MSTIDKVSVWLNRLLTANFFVVLFFFAWFVVAAGGEFLHWHLGWHLWQTLWQPVIQPAVGLVMLGAIGSGILHRLRQRF